jgi:hypothetical protein
LGRDGGVKAVANDAVRVLVKGVVKDGGKGVGSDAENGWGSVPGNSGKDEERALPNLASM